ncbi:hypothetical protein JMN32_05055 [Fulvivirga sp. 29W222]|uniref:Uncharacterized protein n=1 Tax=Fulvivirga marina TaxID=2494733 RepID=A0A937FWH9_9BACT|nr:hypothetical protein [Fulvivirga marina]MBL6445665.1 hypothetical protein [Fulvivirga marina]
MRINEHAVDLVLCLFNECADYYKTKGHMNGFKYSKEVIKGLQTLYNASGLNQDSSFDEFLVFVHNSALQCANDRYIRVAGLAWFLTRTLDVGFRNARNQLSKKNHDCIKTNLLKLQLNNI